MLLSLMSRGLCPLSLGPIVVAGLLVVTMCEASGPQTATQDEDLIRENLPVGSDRVRVIPVLGDRGSRLPGYRREREAVYAIIWSAVYVDVDCAGENIVVLLTEEGKGTHEAQKKNTRGTRNSLHR